jgi:hypothetical protein
MRASLLSVVLASLVTFGASCTAGVGDDPTGGSAPSGGGGSGSGAFNPDGGGGSGANPSNGGAFNDGGSGGGFEECTGVSETAVPELQPADIIIAVDTSGSMSEESDEVQANLNSFASIIDASGVDAHVVLISDATVCIPAPLGSGQCAGADSNLPVYRHVVNVVNSTDGLQVMLDTYPMWKDSLRPGATKTFFIVTDDNSALSAGDFTNALLALDPPTFQGFKFDAICAQSDPLECFGLSCPAGNACCYSPIGFGCDSYAAEEGTVYAQLTAQTGGILADLCAQDFDPIFQSMAEGVVTSSQLSCVYNIPPPPQGETLNPDQVNVTYTPGGGGNDVPIYNVPGGLNACGANGGWYYDDPQNPTQILVCPSTCATLQNDPAGAVDVVFGCDTEVVPE